MARLNVGTDQILVIAVTRAENWEWTETIVETVLSCTSPGDLTVVGGTVPICC